MRVGLSLIPHSGSKYQDKNTLVYKLRNRYRTPKIEIASTLLRLYPGLKIKRIIVLRSGFRYNAKSVSPRTLVVVRVQDKSVTQV